jgi:hypothetical protein
VTLFNAQTFKLLNSASLVGFSGGLRLYLAFLLAGIAPNFVLIIAASLIIYATYTLDRSLENKEDVIVNTGAKIPRTTGIKFPSYVLAKR